MKKKLVTSYGLCILFFLPLVFLPKGFILSRFNLFTHPDLFQLFKVLTFFGDGLLLVICILFLIIFRKKIKILTQKDVYELLIASILMFVIVTLLKNVFFYEITRPIKFFNTLPEEWNPNNFNIRFNKFRSFPSGHSATIAVIGFFTIQHLSNSFLRRLFFFLVLLVGYSRIFLFQHFIVDVLCGLFLGFLCVLLSKQILKIQFKTYKRKAKQVSDIGFNS